MKTRNIKLLLFFWLLFGYMSLQAQEISKIDSLKDLVNRTPIKSERFKLYGQISLEYIKNSQLTLAFNYADSLRLTAEKLKDGNEIANAQFFYGLIARYKGQQDEALNY
ncbi:MAG TPA: hypothetical protein VFD29_03750 [Gillisia sp.]|nr:hypothetical protein [Gillisia sp.]